MKWAFIFAAAALTVAANDSPLVQASKEAKKPKEKAATVVITNATLKKSKAQLSTTKTQKPLPKPQPANDCAVTPLAAPPLAAVPAAKPEVKEAPKMDDAELEMLIEGLASEPIVKPPPNTSSKPQFSPNVSEPQTSQAKKP